MTKNITVRTAKNLWTFEVKSRKGTWYITRIYGDVSNTEALREAVEILQESVNK